MAGHPIFGQLLAVQPFARLFWAPPLSGAAGHFSSHFSAIFGSGPVSHSVAGQPSLNTSLQWSTSCCISSAAWGVCVCCSCKCSPWKIHPFSPCTRVSRSGIPTKVSRKSSQAFRPGVSKKSRKSPQGPEAESQTCQVKISVRDHSKSFGHLGAWRSGDPVYGDWKQSSHKMAQDPNWNRKPEPPEPRKQNRNRQNGCLKLNSRASSSAFS